MYKVNDKVIHSREGLSTIVGQTTFADRTYFIIKPDNGNADNIYVLTDKTENIIRPIMKKDAAISLVKYMKTVVAEFIDNTKQRRDIYKKRLISGNVYDLAYLHVQLYFYEFYNKNGQLVKLGPTDLQILRDARKILFDEFAISFKVSRDSIQPFIEKMIAEL